MQSLTLCVSWQDPSGLDEAVNAGIRIYAEAQSCTLSSVYLSRRQLTCCKLDSNLRFTALHSITVLHSDDSPPFQRTGLQLTIHYLLCITLSIQRTVNFLLAEFQPTITALHFICRDDSRPSAALLRCTVLKQMNSN
jgi:hypothetical protein